MTSLQKGLLASLGVVALIFALTASMGHRFVLLKLASPAMVPPELGHPTEEGLDAIWFDDYFTVFRIDDETYAIGETRYHQMNFNYLLIGDTRAVLFDSGPGLRDITPVIRSLTSLPVTSAVSHLHYDHTGNYNRFEGGAMIDLPDLRELASDGPLVPRDRQHLGFLEGFEATGLNVTEWWKPGEQINLGGRHIVVHHTPGHTPESIILQDPSREQFLQGTPTTRANS